jgi:aminopeptidase-like protein
MAYPEYHTSLDNMELISAAGFQGSLSLLKNIVLTLEANRRPKCTVRCEPQLGKRGLYPSLSTKETRSIVGKMMDLIAYADGTRDLVQIAEKTGVYVGDFIEIAEKLYAAEVLSFHD